MKVNKIGEIYFDENNRLCIRFSKQLSKDIKDTGYEHEMKLVIDAMDDVLDKVWYAIEDNE